MTKELEDMSKDDLKVLLALKIITGESAYSELPNKLKLRLLANLKFLIEQEN